MQMFLSIDDLPTYYSSVDAGMGNTSKWKEPLSERTRSRQHLNLMKLVYGKSTDISTTSSNEAHDTSDEENDGGDFFTPVGRINKVHSLLFF